MAITTVFDPPLVSDDDATFDTKAFDTMGKYNPWSTEANALAVEVNDDAAAAALSESNASSSATAAQSAAATAESVANYQGPWSSLTGAYPVGISSSHNGKTWRLEVATSDITTIEPGVSGDWTDITAVTPSGNNTFTGSNTFAEISEGEFTITGTVIDPANGAFQTKTFTSVEVLTESMTNGQTVRLELIDADTYPPTLPSGTWYTGKGDGVAPALKSKHRIALEKVGGALYYYDLGSTV